MVQLIVVKQWQGCIIVASLISEIKTFYEEDACCSYC